MREIILNCDGWKTRNEFYDAFFAAVGAPEWHGRNFDALNDSICTGSINRVEIPYKILVLNISKAEGEAFSVVNEFISFIHGRSARGCVVTVQVDP